MKVNSIIKSSSQKASHKLSTATVSDEVFGSKENNKLLAQAIRVYLSNKRQGSSKVKTRGEVIGSRRKIWKQKGTGNARHGAKSAPIFVGGGIAHGPTGLENWSRKLSKTMKKKALITALSLQSENIFVTGTLNDLDGKTKTAATLLKDTNLSGKKVLVVTNGDNLLVRRSFNNIQSVEVIDDTLVNALDIASTDAIILSQESVKALESRLVSGEDKKAKAEEKPVAKTSAAKTKKVAAKNVPAKKAESKPTKKAAAKKTEKKVKKA